MFIYPSTIPELTLFAGKPYQFPLYETVSWAGTYTALACVHYFRNDQGETWADLRAVRPEHRLRLPWARRAVRASRLAQQPHGDVASDCRAATHCRNAS